MKECVRNMNGAERKAWRVWRACWFGIYAAVIAALVGTARPGATSAEVMRANIAATDRAGSR
jgi:hypothetical protein